MHAGAFPHFPWGYMLCAMSAYKRISLHEKTVQQAETVSPFIERPAGRRRRPKPGPVERSQVHPSVWAEVRALLDSGRGFTSFEIVSLDDVIVR